MASSGSCVSAWLGQECSLPTLPHTCPASLDQSFLIFQEHKCHFLRETSSLTRWTGLCPCSTLATKQWYMHLLILSSDLPEAAGGQERQNFYVCTLGVWHLTDSLWFCWIKRFSKHAPSSSSTFLFPGCNSPYTLPAIPGHTPSVLPSSSPTIRLTWTGYICSPKWIWSWHAPWFKI